MSETATVEQSQSQEQQPGAQPDQRDHGWPKEALVHEKEGYDHRDPAKKAEETTANSKAYLERVRREESARKKAEAEAVHDPDKRLEQLQKQNDETLRQAVRERPEVNEALSKANDGEALWDAIKDHPELVKDFEKATPEQIQALLAATQEELGNAKREPTEEQRPEPANDYERILKTAAEAGSESFERVSEVLDRFMHPATAQLEAASQVMAAVLANEVAPDRRAAVVHRLMSDAKAAMALETATTAEAIVKAVRDADKSERMSQAKAFYSRFGLKEARKDKQLTSAPPPAPEVGGKSQVAPDALEQALKDGDVEAYRRELNRQIRAGRR